MLVWAGKEETAGRGKVSVKTSKIVAALPYLTACHHTFAGQQRNVNSAACETRLAVALLQYEVAHDCS